MHNTLGGPLMEENFLNPPGNTQFQTHIHQIMERVARAPYTVAPEKREALLRILKTHSVEIAVKDDQSVEFICETIFGHIFTSIRSLQHCWAAACFFASLYCERLKACERGETEIPMVGNEDIETVRALYAMSCEAFRDKKPMIWPPDINLVTPNQEYLVLADEIFLLMCSFTLLHEIGHTESQHNKVKDSTGEQDILKDPHAIELEADKWAYDWILSSWQQYGTDPRIFTKRTLGIIFTLAMTDEFRFLSTSNSISSHPPAVDRLIQFYNDYREQIEENEWSGTCFSAVSLGLQMVAVNNKQPLPQGPYNGIGDFLGKVKKQ